ncbi:MAG: hypothetical protein Q9192_000682 [Flavoplaca navasiana]
MASSNPPPPPPQPYHVMLDNASLFQNVTYAIGQVHFSSIPGSSTHSYITASDSVRKHVALMDHFALLLVYEGSTDVVATGFVKEQNSFKIFWAKNQTYHVGNQEANYLVNLQDAFKRLDPPRQVLKLVAAQCKGKILARAKKLVRAATLDTTQSGNFFRIVESDPRTETMRRFLVDKGLMNNRPLVGALDAFFNDARGLSRASPPDDFVRVLVFAYWLTESGTKLDTVPGVGPILFHRVRKVSAWFLACLSIHCELKKLGPPVLAALRLQRLDPPTPGVFRVHRDTMRALNTWTTRLRLPAFEDFSRVKDFYTTAHPGASGSGPEHVIVASQHCELTVGLHIWSLLLNRRERSTVEIGCSKQSCFYCRLFIDKFNEWVAGHVLPNKIVFRGHHNKYVQGWAMPKNSPAEVRNRVLDAIGEVIQDIYHQVGGPRRRSDSQSPPSQGAANAAEMMAAATLGGERLY